jgi:hypothetical protein
MSATKMMAKWLKTATVAQCIAEKENLEAELQACRNVMVRSSIGQRLRMLESALKAKRAPGDVVMGPWTE